LAPEGSGDRSRIDVELIVKELIRFLHVYPIGITALRRKVPDV
jgi:hypothetical protein